MLSIPISAVMLVIYYEVDEWYQQTGYKLLKGKAGVKPIFSDSEVITLMLAQDFIPYPGENQYLGYMRANYLALFPHLLTQSQYNRRARTLRLLVEAFRRHWLEALGLLNARDLLLDTKPVPVLGYKRSKKHTDFAGSAAYGVCASRNLHYFGYKLVMLSTLDGVPLVYELVAANLHERVAAQAVVYCVRGCRIYADKGFISEDWQHQLFQHTRNRVFTAKRMNQTDQNPPEFDGWLNSIRERIEGLFNELQNTGRKLERLLAKTVLGLTTRVIAKMTSHLVKFMLRQCYGIDVQTFTCTA
jgi:hypothetical protein